jgi:phosphonopyruvate decarboxylase
MGGMGIAAANAGKNFKYILINNGAHESVGGQPTIGFDLDVEAILKASGFKNVYTAETKEDVEAGVKRLRDEALSALIIYTNQGSREDLGRPTIAPEQNKLNMMGEFRKA